MTEERRMFFGAPWDSGVCEGAEQVPTPLGERCTSCAQLVEEGDQGSFTDGGLYPIHRECALRDVLGSVAHLEGRCRCFGGDAEDEHDGDRRASALAVWRWVRERHGLGA